MGPGGLPGLRPGPRGAGTMWGGGRAGRVAVAELDVDVAAAAEHPGAAGVDLRGEHHRLLLFGGRGGGVRTARGGEEEPAGEGEAEKNDREGQGDLPEHVEQVHESSEGGGGDPEGGGAAQGHDGEASGDEGDRLGPARHRLGGGGLGGHGVQVVVDGAAPGDASVGQLDLDGTGHRHLVERQRRRRGGGLWGGLPDRGGNGGCAGEVGGRLADRVLLGIHAGLQGGLGDHGEGRPQVRTGPAFAVVWVEGGRVRRRPCSRRRGPGGPTPRGRR